MSRVPLVDLSGSFEPGSRRGDAVGPEFGGLVGVWWLFANEVGVEAVGVRG